jgi:UDP-N-acetylmuramate dehydrogenase
MIFQNASCYGRELSECFFCARVYDPEQRKIRIFSRDEMHFSYRESILKHSPYVILDADFHFLNKTGDPLQAIRVAAQKRRVTAPEAPSLGSVFLKHEGISIGMLLDRLFQKGRRFGNIAVSRNHAGILVNLGSGTCKEFMAAINALSDLIYRHHGFYPSCEIEFLN